jgi:hypothetical protein
MNVMQLASQQQNWLTFAAEKAFVNECDAAGFTTNKLADICCRESKNIRACNYISDQKNKKLALTAFKLQDNSTVCKRCFLVYRTRNPSLASQTSKTTVLDFLPSY